jgi:hypothetical protein
MRVAIVMPVPVVGPVQFLRHRGEGCVHAPSAEGAHC